MSRHIEEIYIDSFKGIRDLKLLDLGKINILLGGNNSGKTTLLEAIQVLSNPKDFNNIVMIARQRERYKVGYIGARTPFDSFMDIFNKSISEMKMSMGCKVNNQIYNMCLEGSMVKSLLSTEELNRLEKHGRNLEKLSDQEVDVFEGKLHVEVNEHKYDKNILFNKYSRTAVINSGTNIDFDHEFLSTIDHVVNNKFSSIINNKSLTKDVIHLLQESFDKNIIDLRILEDSSGNPYYTLEHKKYGYISLASFGDGIKKVISIAEVASKVNGGVILIDEFETAIHTKAMSNVFKFMLDLSMKNDLQFFLTTHNLEAIETFLNCSGEMLKDIRVITLYDNENNTTARILDGNKALKVKNDLGLELR